MAERIGVGDGDVLLVVDVQYDFCPGGALAVAGGDRVVAPINRLAAGFDHAVMTQDWHPEGHRSFASSHPGRAPFETVEMPYGEQTLWPDHCVQGTPGAEFHRDLALPNCELVVRKGFRAEIDSYSAFLENDHETPTGLAGYLRERGFRRLFVAGLATDFCVYFTAVDGRAAGFDVVLVEDASAPIDLEGSLDAAMRHMHEAGVVVAREADLVL